MGISVISGGITAEGVIEILREKGVDIKETIIDINKDLKLTEGLDIQGSLKIGQDLSVEGSINHKGISSYPFTPLDGYTEMTYYDNSNPPMEMEAGKLNLFGNIASGSSVDFGEDVEVNLPPASPTDGVKVAAAADGVRAIDNEAMKFYANDRAANRVIGQFTNWTTVGYSFWYYNPDNDSWWLV